MKKGVFAVCFTALMLVMGGTLVFSLCSGGKSEVGHGKKVFDNFLAFRHSFYRFQENMEKASAQKHPLNANFQSIAFKINDLTYGDIIPNGNSLFVRLPNAYLTFLYPYSHPLDIWNSQLDFSLWLKTQGVHYLCLIAADKGDDEFAEFPKGIPHGYSRMAEEYKIFLEENGIPYLEAKQSLLKENGDFFHWFYKTDHHWNVHAGLLVAQETAKVLAWSGLAADTAAIRKDKFTLNSYPASFLGSMGVLLGPSYKEDMEVYFPKDETDFHLVIQNIQKYLRGPFSETLIDSECLTEKDCYYSAFLYGNPPLVRIENLRSDNNTRILVIKESKADIMCPYLALTVRYLDMIDPRSFKWSIRSFIEVTRPDMVITCIDVPWEGDQLSWRLK